MNTFGVRDKAVLSSLDLALLTVSANSAPALVKDVPFPDVLLVHAPVILDLTAASSFTPTSVPIVKAPVLRTLLDYPLLNLTVEVPVVDVSKVLYLPALLLLVLLLSVSSSAAVVLVPVLD